MDEMNPATVAPLAAPRREFDPDRDITCMFSLKLCAALSVDTVCCLPFCCFCGGCCGRIPPVIGLVMPEAIEDIKPGWDLCGVTCTTQCLAMSFMPFTGCGCLWACCGICTPLVKCVIKSTNTVDKNASKKAKAMMTTPPQAVSEAMHR